MAAVTDPVLFLVPARGGSRRVPGKNLRRVAGIPLVGQAIRTARLAAAGLPDGPHAIVCSTDDEMIANVARSWGGEVPFIRPKQLATDDATSADVALHALATLEEAGRRFRAIVLVQPTSPLTDPADLRAAVERFDRSAARASSASPGRIRPPGTSRRPRGPGPDRGNRKHRRRVAADRRLLRRGPGRAPPERTLRRDRPDDRLAGRRGAQRRHRPQDRLRPRRSRGRGPTDPNRDPGRPGARCRRDLRDRRNRRQP